MHVHFVIELLSLSSLAVTNVDIDMIIFRYQSGGDESDSTSGGLRTEANPDGAALKRKTPGSVGGDAPPGQTSKTISAPTSPLKEKRGAGFFGKVRGKLWFHCTFLILTHMMRIIF